MLWTMDVNRRERKVLDNICPLILKLKRIYFHFFVFVVVLRVKYFPLSY